jgi:hypothetical protein
MTQRLESGVLGLGVAGVAEKSGLAVGGRVKGGEPELAGLEERVGCKCARTGAVVNAGLSCWKAWRAGS